MAAPQAPDDWIAPGQSTSAPADDWIVPEKPKLAAARDYLDEHGPLAHVRDTAGKAMAEGFGSQPLGIEGGGETDKALTKLGIFHEPGKGYVGPAGSVQLLNEAILRPTAASVDAIFRAIGAGIAGAGAAAGQVAENLGASHGSGQQLARDVSGNIEIGLMSHVPEADLLRGAQAGKYAKVQATPEEIDDFLARAAEAPNAPAPPPSKVRQEIDEFLRQRAAREAAEPAPAGAPRLPPPDDWTVPPADVAPGAPPSPAPAGAAIDAAYPSFEEPGRTAPAAPQEVPNDRQGGQQVLGQVGEGQEPGNVQQQGGGGAPAQAGGILQTPQGTPAPDNAAGQNLTAGGVTLDQLLADPRSADEIRTDRAAQRGVADAVAQRGAADAAVRPNVTTTPSVITLGPPAPAPVQMGVNPQPPPSLEALLADPRSADEIRAAIEAARNWQPTEDWQVVPPGVTLDPQLEVRTENGQTVARIPPPAGTRDNPVVIALPGDVHAGREITATPTPAQAEAGNYQKRHIQWNGLDLAIETEAGSQRKGVGPTGEPWAVTLQHPYGYAKGTKGADGEGVDFYLGPQPQSPHVFVVDQVDPQTGAFDEHKALIGFPDEAAARAAYEAGFSDNRGGDRLGAVAPLSVEQFKTWLQGHLRTPLAYSDPVEAARAIAKEQGLNPTDAALGAAGMAQKVNNVDPSTALHTAIEREALVDLDRAIDNARAEGIGDAWTSIPVAKGEAGEGIAPAGERPAEAQGALPSETAPARVEPDEAQRDRGAAEPVEPEAPAVTRDEAPAEPELAEATDLTTARLTKLAKQIPSMAPADRADTRARIDDLMARMEADGRKIAEHCLETAGKFSLRG